MAQMTVSQSSPVTVKDIKEFGHSDGPCITILLPVSVRGGSKKSLSARLKAAAELAEAQLGERMIVSTVVRKLIDPIVEFAGRIEDEAQGSTLAVFRSEEYLRHFWLNDVMDETVVAANNFFVRPLLQGLQGVNQFYILALDQKNIRLLRCTDHSSEEVDLQDYVPRSLDDHANVDLSPDVQGAGGPANGSGSGAMFTSSIAADGTPEYLSQFYKAVSTGIASLLRGQEKTPLVLCGVERELALYKRVDTWEGTVDEGVRGAPNGLKGGEMHARALECLQRMRERQVEEVLSQYDKQAGEVATSGVNDLVKAAHEGRIFHLFVAENAQAMGNFDEASHRARTHQVARPGDEDLINAAAIQTILHAGQVHVMPQARVPGNRPMAAIMRY